MFDEQISKIVMSVVIFVTGIYMMKTVYSTSESKEQYKDGDIDSGMSPKEWEKVCKKVSEKEAYVLEIGDASWAGSKERMLEILIYNKMIYEENGEPFDFEIYPMIPKRWDK